MVWLNKGARLEAVQVMLGHKSITTTERHYAKILRAGLEKDTEDLF